jgi:hypothetical protein
MKKILFFLMLAGAMVVYGQTDQPLTSLPTATDPDADDVTYIVEDGVSKKLTMGQIASYVADSGYVQINVNQLYPLTGGTITLNNSLLFTGTVMQLTNIPESKASKILYYNPATSQVTYGDSTQASGGGGGLDSERLDSAMAGYYSFHPFNGDTIDGADYTDGSQNYINDVTGTTWLEVSNSKVTQLGTQRDTLILQGDFSHTVKPYTNQLYLFGEQENSLVSAWSEVVKVQQYKSDGNGLRTHSNGALLVPVDDGDSIIMPQYRGAWTQLQSQGASAAKPIQIGEATLFENFASFSNYTGIDSLIMHQLSTNDGGMPTDSLTAYYGIYHGPWLSSYITAKDRNYFFYSTHGDGYLNGDLEVTGDLTVGGTYPGGGGGSTNVFQDSLGWFDVKAYGAVGNGIADDRAAIQAAIDAADDGVVYFPPGIYDVGDSILITNSVTIIGAGSGGDCRIVATTDNPVFHVDDGDAYAYPGVIRDIMIQGTNNASHTDQHGIVFSSLHSWDVERVFFYQLGGSGIWFGHDPVGGQTIRKSVFRNNHASAIYGRNQPDNNNAQINAIDINNCWIDDNYLHGVDIIGNNINITENIIERNYGRGIKIAADNCPTADNVTGSGINIKGNYLERNGWDGASSYDSSEIYIEAGYLTGSNLKYIYNLTIEDNFIISWGNANCIEAGVYPGASALGFNNCYIGRNSYTAASGVFFDGGNAMDEDNKLWIDNQTTWTSEYINLRSDLIIERDGMGYLEPVSSPYVTREGSYYYDADDNTPYIYNGTGWDAMTGGGASADTTNLSHRADTIAADLNALTAQVNDTTNYMDTLFFNAAKTVYIYTLNDSMMFKDAHYGPFSLGQLSTGGGGADSVLVAEAAYDFEMNTNDTIGTADLTLNGGATYDTGGAPWNNYFLDCNGAGRYATVPSRTYNSSFTIGFYFQAASTGTKYVLGADEFRIQMDYANDDIYFYELNGASSEASADNCGINYKDG